MIVIPPMTFTDAMLTSSVVETAPAAYAAGTSYALGNTCSVAYAAGLITTYASLQAGNIGHTPSLSPTWWASIGDTYQIWALGTSYALADRVIDPGTHRVYESLQAANIGHTLATSPTWWLLIGPDNRWAMFDTLRNTATTVPMALTVVLTPGARVDAIALLGLQANAYHLSITSVYGGGTVYDTGVVSLNEREVLDWYGYFFKPFVTKNSVAKFDLPPYTDAIITLTLTATSGNVSCGAVVCGLQVYLGAIQYSADNDVLNFSTVTRDFAGGTNAMVQRRNVPKTIQSIWCDSANINVIRELRDSLNAVPAVWAGINDDTSAYFEAILILGFYKKFSINIKSPVEAIVSLELEEI